MSNPNLQLGLKDYAPFALSVARRLGRDDEDVSDRFLAALTAAGTAPLKGGPTPLETGDPLAVVKAMAKGAATGQVAQQISVPAVPASSLCQEDEDGEMESEDECLERVSLDDILSQVMDDWDDQPDVLAIAEETLRELAENLDDLRDNILLSTEEANRGIEHIKARIARIETAVQEYKDTPFTSRGDVENPVPLYPFIEDRNSDRAREHYRTQVEAGLAGTIEWLGDPFELCGVDEFEHEEDVQARDKEIVSGDFIRLPDGKFKFVPPENIHLVQRRLPGPVEWIMAGDPLHWVPDNTVQGHIHLDFRHEKMPASWVAPYAFRDIREAWGKPKFAKVLREIVRGSRLDDEQNLAELIVMLGRHMVRTAEDRDMSLASSARDALKRSHKKGEKPSKIAYLKKVLKDLDERLARPDPDIERFIDAALPALGLAPDHRKVIGSLYGMRMAEPPDAWLPESPDKGWAGAWMESADWGEGVALDANDAGNGDISDILWPDADPASDEDTIPEMEWGSDDLSPLLAKIQSFGSEGWKSAVWMRAFIPVFASGAPFKEANAAGKAAWMKARHYTPKPVGVRPVVSLGAACPA